MYTTSIDVTFETSSMSVPSMTYWLASRSCIKGFPGQIPLGPRVSHHPQTRRGVDLPSESVSIVPLDVSYTLKIPLTKTEQPKQIKLRVNYILVSIASSVVFSCSRFQPRVYLCTTGNEQQYPCTPMAIKKQKIMYF